MWKGEKLKENEGLVYKHMTFVEGNKDVLGVLKDVADQVDSACPLLLELGADLSLSLTG